MAKTLGNERAAKPLIIYVRPKAIINGQQSEVGRAVQRRVAELTHENRVLRILVSQVEGDIQRLRRKVVDD